MASEAATTGAASAAIPFPANIFTTALSLFLKPGKSAGLTQGDKAARDLAKWGGISTLAAQSAAINQPHLVQRAAQLGQLSPTEQALASRYLEAGQVARSADAATRALGIGTWLTFQRALESGGGPPNTTNVPTLPAYPPGLFTRATQTVLDLLQRTKDTAPPSGRRGWGVPTPPVPRQPPRRNPVPGTTGYPTPTTRRRRDMPLNDGGLFGDLLGAAGKILPQIFQPSPIYNFGPQNPLPVHQADLQLPGFDVPGVDFGVQPGCIVPRPYAGMRMPHTVDVPNGKGGTVTYVKAPKAIYKVSVRQPRRCRRGR